MSWFKKKLSSYANYDGEHYNGSEAPYVSGKSSDDLYTAQPESFAGLKPIALNLLKYKKLQLDTKQLSGIDRKRTLDFISGIMFAFSGTVEIIEPYVYLFDISSSPVPDKDVNNSDEHDAW